ncbi:hypothetical protein ABZZ74_18190 [Streptomyces sp. NPDC006476]|uniref:hypothetical protein n=1 Tax=Streptomyces sp. NPDC006476 TaxID=3157175 RepID=UPI0033A2D145
MRVFQLVNSDAFDPSDVARLHTELRRAGIAEPGPLLEAYRAHTGASDLADLRAAFLGDAVFRAPATHLARAQVAVRGGAYRHLLLDEPCGSTLGTFHGADLLYLLAKLSLVDAETPHISRSATPDRRLGRLRGDRRAGPAIERCRLEGQLLCHRRPLTDRRPDDHRASGGRRHRAVARRGRRSPRPFRALTRGCAPPSVSPRAAPC